MVRMERLMVYACVHSFLFWFPQAKTKKACQVKLMIKPGKNWHYKTHEVEQFSLEYYDFYQSTKMYRPSASR